MRDLGCVNVAEKVDRLEAGMVLITPDPYVLVFEQVSPSNHEEVSRIAIIRVISREENRVISFHHGEGKARPGLAPDFDGNVVGCVTRGYELAAVADQRVAASDVLQHQFNVDLSVESGLVHDVDPSGETDVHALARVF